MSRTALYRIVFTLVYSKIMVTGPALLLQPSLLVNVASKSKSTASDESKYSTGELILIVLGSIAGFIIIVVFGCLLHCHRRYASNYAVLVQFLDGLHKGIYSVFNLIWERSHRYLRKV